MRLLPGGSPVFQSASWWGFTIHLRGVDLGRAARRVRLARRQARQHLRLVAQWPEHRVAPGVAGSNPAQPNAWRRRGEMTRTHNMDP